MCRMKASLKKTSEAIYERLKPQGVNTLVTGPIKINGKMVGFYGVTILPKRNCMRSRI